MAWTASNPVTIGNPTKKSDYDNAWDNIDFLKGGLWLHNLGLAASVSSKALTVALKGADGNNASATNPVTIGFRSATLTTGTPVIRTVTGALSVVLSSGSTLGFTAALAGRIYVWAIDNAGTVVLGLSRTADIFPESNLVSTTAEGGAGAADSASVMYSTAAQTNKACRCIGYIEITTGATPGEWDNDPTVIQVMGPGIKRTGDVIGMPQQVVKTDTFTGTSGSPADITGMSVTIPMTSNCNKVLVDVDYRAAAANQAYTQLNRAGTAICIGDAAGSRSRSSSGDLQHSTYELGDKHIQYLDSPATAGDVIYKLQYSILGGSTFYFNRTANDGDSAGTERSASSMRVTEIMA